MVAKLEGASRSNDFPQDYLCWVISDGTAGMHAQSVAVAQALDVPYYDVRIFASPIYRLFPQMGAVPFMPISPRRSDRKLGPPWPDLVITTGKRTTGAALAIKRLSGGKTKIIQVQDPKINPAHFDVMIVPKHDALSQSGLPHIVPIMGSLNKFTMPQIATESKAVRKKFAKITSAKTAVMIGGTNRRYKASPSDFYALGQKLADYAKQAKTHLILISSRRTPKQGMAALQEGLGKIRYFLWDHKGDHKSDNPYPGILAVVDDVIVTSDSVNMVSEACLTGKPVYVAELQAETGRIAAFHQMMMTAGHTKWLGQAFTAPPVILDQSAYVAEQVKKHLI
ncbi:MAG: mitochondrial fission ELM1 family protein [Candidatus Puniceispirillaceae bacterium]